MAPSVLAASAPRLAVLYLRSRLIGPALATALAIAAFAWWGLGEADSELMIRLLLVTTPLVVACAVVVTARSPFGEAERTASLRLPLVRLGHLAAVLAVAALALAIANAAESEPWAAGVLARNLAGFAGLALLAARLVGTGASWLLPLFWGMAALVAGSERQWAWPIEAGDDRWATRIALGLLALGLLAVVPAGARDARDGSE